MSPQAFPVPDDELPASALTWLSPYTFRVADLGTGGTGVGNSAGYITRHGRLVVVNIHFTTTSGTVNPFVNMAQLPIGWRPVALAMGMCRNESRGNYAAARVMPTGYLQLGEPYGSGPTSQANDDWTFSCAFVAA